ncbi:MAG: circularly permuted type 2 ATP-grasp protein [Rhodospirillales bacterium]
MASQSQSSTAEAEGTLFSDYDSGGFYCELFEACGRDATAAQELVKRLNAYTTADLSERAAAAERELMLLGVTFTVYTQRRSIDRTLPFDVIPRVLTGDEWDGLSRGVAQRVKAINLFLADIYGPQAILNDGTVPKALVLGNENYRPIMREIPVPHGSYVVINGTDLVRGGDGKFRVLEDNCRTPSGVSYVVENRHLMQRAFPDLVQDLAIRPVSDYGQRLARTLGELAPDGVSRPLVALLSPGTYNSAYFEHVFLAREAGITLVEGQDLVVEDDRVYARTIKGLQEVHVLYRRIDDAFLDPRVFNPDSLLGVPGLVGAMAKGRVTLANAIGTGVADDKAVYAYMPRIIRYYLDEEPIIENVQTHICGEPEGLAYTLAHLPDLVVKPVGESGGYGIVIGPHASQAELDDIRAKVIAEPANYIAQPMIELSVSPTLMEGEVGPRHVDLRPFALTGRSTWVLPGGLSRVALRKGSLVVNSSQGGGSKDTWVLD